MMSAASHGWDEQDQGEVLEKMNIKPKMLCGFQRNHVTSIDPALAMKGFEKNPELLGKMEWIHVHDAQEWLDNLLEEEIERGLKVEMEHNNMDEFEWHMGRVYYFHKPLTVLELQPLPDDLPLFLQTERLFKVDKFKRRMYRTWADINKMNSVRKLYLYPNNGDNQLEARNKVIQIMSLDFYNFGDTSDSLHIYVLPRGILGMLTTNKKSSGTIAANRRPGAKGFAQHCAEAEGTRVRKNIFVISSADNGGSGSEGTGSTVTGGKNHHSEIDSAYNDMPQVILDNQAQVHCTGNFSVLSNLSMGAQDVVLIAANNGEMETYMSGSVRQANLEVNDVLYCPDLGNRIIISGSMLESLDYEYKFSRKKFVVTDLTTGRIVGEGRLVDGNYIVDYLKTIGDRTHPAPEQPGPVTTLWNAVSSALRRLGLKE